MSSGPSAMSVKITTQFSITIVVTILVQGTLTGHTGAPAPEGEYGIWRESAAQPGVEDNYKSIC